MLRYYQLVAPPEGQAPVPTVVQERVVVPAALAIVNWLPDFEWAMIV